MKEEAFERNYVIADCCKPIPGDESLGFINDDGNVVVHKRACPIAMRLKSSFGERILNTEWSIHHSSFESHHFQKDNQYHDIKLPLSISSKSWLLYM